MDIEAITLKLVDRTLRDWQQGNDTPDEWLSADFVMLMDGSSYEKLENFRDMVTNHVRQELARCRRIAGVRSNDQPPNTLEKLYRCIAADFEPENTRLEAWSALYYRYLEEDYSPQVKDIAEATLINERLFARRVKAGLGELRRFLAHKEMEIHRTTHAAHLRHDSEVPELKTLHGSMMPLQTVKRLLMDEEGPRFISIEGIGGIGKTALARAVAEKMTEEMYYQRVIWISARQEWFNERGQLVGRNDPVRTFEDIVAKMVKKLDYPHLEQLPTDEILINLSPALVNTRLLIVIDNLETVTDSELLPPKLHPLAGQTRFLLTSRNTLRHYDYVYTMPVPELSSVESRLLLDAEIARVEQKRRLTIEQGHEIYKVVGGIPLALKLTAAQLAQLPLHEVLGNLREAKRTAPETMFKYIYRKTWTLLGEDAQLLLLAMCDIAPDGAEIDWVRSMAYGSGLDEERFQAALSQLRDYSLLEINRSFSEPHYRLHRLTVTFLHTEVFKHRWATE